MNSEKLDVILFHYKSIDCSFPLIYQSQETGLYKVTWEVSCRTYRPLCGPRLIRYLCRVRHWYSLASRRPRSVFLPLQLFLLSILCSPCPTPLALKCLSCTGLCSRPPSLLIHICVHGFSDYQLADDSQILSAAHLSFLRYRYVYIAAFSDATFFRCFRLNSPFSSKAPWLLRFYCQATIGPV